MTSYDGWADVYDSIYAYVREDIPFYVQEAVRSGGPVLEIGCGTGRVTLPIAQSGVDIVGLDNSDTMLERARGKARLLEEGDGSIDLRMGDMREFSLGRTFSLVIIPFRGFLALLSVEDQVRCLTAIREHLEPDGRLIFNIFVPDPQMLVEDEDAAFHLRDVADPDTGRTSVVWQQTRVDIFNQVLSVRLIVDQIDQEGAVGKRFYRDYQIRYAHRIEILHLLERCGFEVVDLYGDFDYSPFDEDSGEMVWVAKPRATAIRP
ncbi:MAG: class I SAM-dependent methyltransferase [Dehalococcoidia bacterium]|nr:class I SAM-dependent methyltransferase [Dehalococcoidia bacterium]